MSRIQKLEIQKLLREYNFLLIDDEYKQEVISENKNEFLTKVEDLKKELGFSDNEEFNNKDEVNYELDGDKDIKEEDINIPKKPKIDPDSISNSTKDKVKKIYREIVKITHPDKTKSKDLVDLYLRATVASEDYNLFDLFIICMELNIDLDIDLDDKKVLTTIIDMKKKELKSIESSFIWLYVNSNNDEEKNNLIKLFVEKHGKKS